MSRKIYLIDMDRTIVDFDKAAKELFFKHELNKIVPYIPVEERKSYFFKAEYSKEISDKLNECYHEPGFFLNMEPLEGAIEGVLDLQRNYGEVFFCSTPLSRSSYCSSEKEQWIDKYFGNADEIRWRKKLVLAYDKTLVHGDFLIDDKPEIKGVEEPSWEHILYDWPFNRDVDKRRMTWQTYKGLFIKEK